MWSEKQSVVGGVIEAKGGDLGGNGGLVETSGRTGLTIVPNTSVMTAAPKGKSGTWLLDPAGISIEPPPATTNATTAGGPPPTAVSYTQNLAVNTVAANDILASLLVGSNVTVKTTGFPLNADIIVNADLPLTGLFAANFLSFNSAGGITVNKVVGGPTSNINISFKAANGNIAFAGTGAAQVSSAGTVFLDTHLSSSATITSGVGNAVMAGKLDITSGRQGIGTSVNPFLTSVSNVEATVASNAQTTGGGIFIKNSGTTLHIGGVDPSLNGVQVSNINGFGGIEITNVGGDIMLDSTSAERITAPGNIKLTTTGSNDIVIINSSPNSLRSSLGSVTLNAGGNVIIGDATHVGANVRGQTGVTVQAGGDVTVAGSLLKSVGGSGVSVTVGGDVNIISSSGFAATIGTSGSAPISLTTGAGKTFNNNTLSNGGLRTTLTTAADETPPNVPSNGGSISIFSDNVTINSPINAGIAAVYLSPVSPTRAVLLGSKQAGSLGLVDSELGMITASQVNVAATGAANLTVSGPISSLTSNGLGLSAGGQIFVNGGIERNHGSIGLFAVGNISGAFNIAASGVTMGSTNGSINYTGPITRPTSGIRNLILAANAAQAINFTSGSNEITTLGSISRGGDLTIRNTIPLTIDGDITGGNTASNVTIRTVGDMILTASASIRATGAHLITLEAFNGYFINNGGPAAMQVSGGARFLVYSQDKLAPFNAGGLDKPPGNATYGSANTFVGSDPVGTGNVFYFQNVNAAGPQSAGGPQPAGGQKPAIAAVGNALQPTAPNLDSLDIMPAGYLLQQPTFYKATLTVEHIDEPVDPRTDYEKKMDYVGSDILAAADGSRLADYVYWSAHDLFPATWRASKSQTNEIVDLARSADADGRPWKILDTFGFPGADKPGTVVIRDGNQFGSSISVVFDYDNGRKFNVPPGGSLETDWQGLFVIKDAAGNKIASGKSPMVVSTGTANKENSNMTELASGHTDVAHAEKIAGPSVVLSNGKRVFVPQDPPSIVQDASGRLQPTGGSLLNLVTGFGKSLSSSQITNIADLVAAGGGNLKRDDIASLVAAGGGNFSAGVVASIISGSGGKLSSSAIASLVAAGGGNLVAAGGGNLVAAGGGNLIPSAAMMQIISAGLVAAGGGNLVAAGGGNLVAAGAGNFSPQMVSSLVAAGGGNLSNADVVRLVAAGGGNVVSNDGNSLVAAGGGNVVSNDGNSLVAAGGGNIISNIAAALVAAGGGNLIANDGGTLVAAGGGNLVNSVVSLLQNGGGPGLASSVASGSSLASIAANLVSAGGGNAVPISTSSLLGPGGSLLGPGNSLLGPGNSLLGPGNSLLGPGNSLLGPGAGLTSPVMNGAGIAPSR